MKKRVLIFHLNQLGDFLFSLPLLASLKFHDKDLSITSVLPSSLLSLTRYQTHLIDVIAQKDCSRELRKALRESYDLILCLSQSPRTLLMTARVHGKRAGFTSLPGRGLFDIQVERLGPPSIINNMRLLEACGIPASTWTYEGLLRIPPTPNGEGDLLVRENALSNILEYPARIARTIAIHPGSGPRRHLKTWPTHYYASLVRLLVKELGCDVLLTGSVAEQEITHSIQQSCGVSVKNLAGKTDLPTLSRLFKRCHLVIGNDSGPLHLAAALGTATLTIFGPTDPSHTAPQGRGATQLAAFFPCQPCLEKADCRFNVCMDAITPEEVFFAASQKLARSFS